MPKETQATQAKIEQKSRLKVEGKPVFEQAEELLFSQPIAGVAMAANGGNIDTQGAQLRAASLQLAQRRAIAGEIGRMQGNTHLQRVIEKTYSGRVESQTGLPSVQRGPDNPRARRGTGGAGPGRMQNSTEQPYDVTGSTLDEVSTQLTGLGGFAAQTNTPITINGRVQPQRQADGTYQVRVQWVIRGATTQLPRWTGYNAACPAAQQEWDRFMGQVRAHEQQAHVNAARDFVSNLGEEDTLITGASVEEVQSNLQAKQEELAGRLQAIHDGCGHGADIDAILHPENGVCEEAE